MVTRRVIRTVVEQPHSTQLRTIIREALALGLPANALPVPLVRQQLTWSCGAAAVLAAARAFGIADTSEAQVRRLCGTRRSDGTSPEGIRAGARALGLSAEVLDRMDVADLLALPAGGWAPIVDLQAWSDSERPGAWGAQWACGHYAVLVGADAANAYFMDPAVSGAYAWLPLAELGPRWHDVGSDGKVERRLAVAVRGRRLALRAPETGAVTRMGGPLAAASDAAAFQAAASRRAL